MERMTMSRKDAAIFIGISEWLLWRLTKEGQIPSFKAGSRVLYRRETLEKWMTEQEQNN